MSVFNFTKPDFTMYPLLWLAACFAAGISIPVIISFSWSVYLLICLISAACAAVFAGQKFALIFLLSSFIAAGALYSAVENRETSGNRLKTLYDAHHLNSGDPVEIEGVLQKEPEAAMGGIFFFIKAEKAFYKGAEHKVSGNIRLFAPVRDEQVSVEYAQLNLGYGSKILVACHLIREDNFLNPGVNSRKKILDQQETDATAVLKSPLLIEKISDPESFSLAGAVYKYRRKLIDKFRAQFDHSASGILIASLLGNRYFLDKRTAEVFREGGTFHVLVISGLHITFIGGLVLLFVRFFTKKRFWQFALASVVLWIYALAVGAEVPVTRAALMFTILLFSQVIYRRGTLLNALGASVLILLVWRPADVFNPSFHLTIISVAAIVATAFPLIENLRSIGRWSPSAETPFPPDVSPVLKRFCETLYWRDNVWQRDMSRQIWSARLFKAPYLKRLANGQKILSFGFEGILISLIVQIWLLPLLIVYFHRLSFFSVILNLWVGINLALESLAAVFALFLAQINENLALPFIKITGLLNWFLLFVPRILMENDLASIRIPVYSGNFKAIYLLYFVPLIAFTFLLHNWNPFAPGSKVEVRSSKFRYILTPLFVLFIALIVFHPFSAQRADGRLRVEFLDVGQGDSIFITFPGGETMLVDGGGKANFNKTSIRDENGVESEFFEPDALSIGEAVVSEFLWERGLSKIDYILATHADADHIQGLTDAAKNFRVKKAFFGRTPFEDEDFLALFRMLEKRNIEPEIIARGDVLNIGNVRIEILYPERDASSEAVSGNNDSIVMRLIFGGRKFLLTGDIERETEKFLAENAAIEADVVKVAHHGSRTSSTAAFIEATRAVYAIIPVGRKSRFGHPHEEVTERWQQSGAKTLTTGERGTVSISTDGSDLRVETFLK